MQQQYIRLKVTTKLLRKCTERSQMSSLIHLCQLSKCFVEITGAFALMRAFSICQHLSSSDFVTYHLTYVLKWLDLCTNAEHQGKNTGEKSGAIKLANPARVTVTIDSEDLIKDSSQ